MAQKLAKKKSSTNFRILVAAPIAIASVGLGVYLLTATHASAPVSVLVRMSGTSGSSRYFKVNSDGSGAPVELKPTTGLSLPFAEDEMPHSSADFSQVVGPTSDVKGNNSAVSVYTLVSSSGGPATAKLSNLTNGVSNPNIERPRLSTDGKHLAYYLDSFSKTAPAGIGIYVATIENTGGNVTATNVKRVHVPVKLQSGGVGNIYWQPGGTKIAYTEGSSGAGKGSHLFSVDMNGSQSQTPVSYGDADDFAWSNDGTMMATVSSNDGALHIYTSAGKLKGPSYSFPHVGLITSLQSVYFSPDNQWVAFTLNDGLHAYNQRTRKARLITSRSVDNIKWLPNGQIVGEVSDPKNQNLDIASINPSNGVTKTIFKPFDVADLATLDFEP